MGTGADEKGGNVPVQSPTDTEKEEVTVTVCSPAAEAAAQPAPDKAENNDPDTTSTAPAIASDPPPGKEASGVEPPPPTPSKKSGEEEEEEKNPSSSADASDARGAGPGTKDAPNGGEGVGGPSGEGGGSIGDDGDGPAGDAMVRAGSAIGEEEEEMAVCITVYPPQRSGAAPLMLEPLAGVELVMQIRQLLGEVPQTCLYSAFRLVAVAPRGGGGGGDQEDVWKREGEVMNDYVELRSIAAIAARPEKVQVRMELEAYTTHTARQHVQKLRELLRYPPPCADGVGPGAKSGNGKKSKGKGGGGGGGKNRKPKDSASVAAGGGGKIPASPGGATAEKTPATADASAPAAADPVAEDMAQRVQRALDIRGRLKDSRVPVGEGLGCFYGVGLGLAVEEVANPSKEEMAAASGKGGDKDKEAPITCLRGVAVSSWNPPPPQRRLVGDLMYLEVTALDGTVIHVTCTQGGFYVNGTRRDNFDPKPASNNPCHSHELATCLLAYSPSFAKAWNNAVAQAWRRSQADDPVHALARAMREGRGDAVMVKLQWNVPVPDPKWAAHKADPSRAQEDLSNGFGMEDRGVPREWNDEYQCLLELPSDTPDLSMTRSRALHKLLCDFQEAATAGALAISDGHIPPANPTEAEHSHVFVFNNIFFSYAADSTDAYKAVQGEAAARKAASQDLASVVALNTLSEALHPQLGIKTLATAVIDYSGRRLIAQSLVPGILNTDKVVYGAMEHGQRLRENAKISSLLREVGERLMIAEREVEAVPIKKCEGFEKKDGGSKEGTEGKVDEEESAAATTATVRITGAVEMKGIVGSDGRSYLLDVSRLSPRDANWVRGVKGTGVYDDWVQAHDDKPIPPGSWEGECGEGPDLSFEDMAVLRPSLLNMFTRHKMGKWFRGKDAQILGGVGTEAAVGAAFGTSDADEVEPSGGPFLEANAPNAEDLVTAESVAEASGKGAVSDGGGVNGNTMATTGSEGREVKASPSASTGEAKGGGGGEERKRGVGEDAERKVLPTRVSEEDVARLKEEQDAKCKELEINVNVFMPYKGCVDEEQLSVDEALAREAARYLWDVALPFVTMEVKRGAVCPLDCAELAQTLHGAGVNMRYMGRLAAVAVAEEAEDVAVRAEGKLRRWRMPLFWLEMLETEMVARAATHVFARYMGVGSSRSRSAPGYAIQQFLNCLLGGSAKGDLKTGAMANGSTPSAIPPRAATASAAIGVTSPTISADSTWMPEDGEVVALTHEGLWCSLQAEVAARFRHRLTIWGRKATAASHPNNGRAHKLPLLRRVCQRLGLRVVSRSYDMNRTEPLSLEDIVSTYPVVKSCVPVSPAPDAAEALDMAQLHLSSGMGLQPAHDLAQHAATMLLQACDGMHSKYPAALNLQARVMYHVGDADSAVALQLKALAYFEQLEGLDSSAVVKCHEHLGQYYMLAGVYDKALAHMRAFCYLLELTAGPNHPDLASGYHRMGRAYQDVGCGMMALRCYQEALERQAGDHMVNPRVHHSVAETLEAMRGYADALKHERLSHAGYKAVHGDQHPMVVKSTENIRALTTKIVKVAQEQTAQSGPSTNASQPHRSGKTNSSSPSSSITARDVPKSAKSASPVESKGRVDEGSGGARGGGVEETKLNGPPSRAVGGEVRGEGEGDGKQGSPGGGGVSNGGSGSGSKSSTKKKGRR